jgi:hypothetical protein
MHPTNCLNCATLLTADDRFCPSCGQKTDTHRLKMSHIWHDIGHAFTHTDKGFFYTIKELAVRPGRVVREYVEGKRKKYFNPFSFLLIIIGLQLIANSVFKPYSQDFGQRPTITNSEQQRRYAPYLRRGNNYREFMNKRTNIVVLISTPFIAFILWLLFKRRGYNYAEHLVAMAFLNGYLHLIITFIFAPLLYLTRNTPSAQPVYYLMMLSHIFYIGFMYYGFMGYTSRSGYWKTMGAGLLAILAWAVLSLGIGTLYIWYGP